MYHNVLLVECIGMRSIILFFMILILGAVQFTVVSQDFVIDDSSPYASANGLCSLIEAIDNANDDAMTHADCPVGTGVDTITLSQDITLDGTTTFAVQGDNGLPSITSDLTIVGDGFTIQRANSAPAFRIFHVDTIGDLTLENIVVRNGLLTANFDNGGGILNNGNLTLITSLIEDNRVETVFPSGGGIYNSNTGILTIIDTAIQDNSVFSGSSVFDNGGGIYSLGDLTMTNTLVRRNTAEEQAGGIFASGNTNVNNSQIADNSALDGGGMVLFGTAGASMRINNTVFSGNSALENGGAILNGNDDVEIFGSSFINNIVQGNPSGTGGAIQNFAGTMTITASLFDGNQTLNDAIAGAIYNGQLGEVTLIGSIVQNNTSQTSGGGLATSLAEFFVQDSLILNNSAPNGGGFHQLPSNVDGFTIERTTVMGNTADDIGGGFYGTGNLSTATILNSTFTGNTAGLIGGGIGLNSGGLVDILNSTIVDNSNTLFINSIGGINAFAGEMTIGNSIVANNVNRDCSATSSSTSLDNNITTGPGGGIPLNRWCSFIPLQPNDQLLTDPLLEPLANNGNTGPTYLLQAGSPAIDAISGTCPIQLNGIDQRGVPRGGGSCDVGAIADDTAILPEVYFETVSTVIDDEGTVTTTQNINLIVDNMYGTLVAPGSLPLTIFVTQRGSATDDLDYSSSSTTPLVFTFNAGNWVAPNNSQTLTIPIDVIDDLLPEADETIQFDLIVIGPGVLRTGQSSHLVQIIDDDVIPQNNDDDEAEEESEDGQEPIIDVFDPAISKLGLLLPGELGVRGEALRWDVTVTNRGAVAGTNVVVTDTLRPELRIDNVTTSRGQINVNGQTVTVTIPVLNPGEQVNIAIFTTSLDGALVDNTACVDADNQPESECVSVLPVQTLPNTGQTPNWRNHLILLFLLGICTVSIGIYQFNHHPHNR